MDSIFSHSRAVAYRPCRIVVTSRNSFRFLPKRKLFGIESECNGARRSKSIRLIAAGNETKMTIVIAAAPCRYEIIPSVRVFETFGSDGILIIWIRIGSRSRKFLATSDPPMRNWTFSDSTQLCGTSPNGGNSTARISIKNLESNFPCEASLLRKSISNLGCARTRHLYRTARGNAPGCTRVAGSNDRGFQRKCFSLSLAIDRCFVSHKLKSVIQRKHNSRSKTRISRASWTSFRVVLWQFRYDSVQWVSLRMFIRFARNVQKQRVMTRNTAPGISFSPFINTIGLSRDLHKFVETCRRWPRTSPTFEYWLSPNQKKKRMPRTRKLYSKHFCIIYRGTSCIVFRIPRVTQFYTLKNERSVTSKWPDTLF